MKDNERLKITVNLGAEDFKSFNFYVHKRKTFILVPAYLLLIFAILFFTNIVDISNVSLRAVVSLGISAIVSALFILILSISINSKSKKLIQLDKSLGDTQVLTIDREGIHSESPKGEAELKWNNVLKIEKSKKGIYIFISKNEAIIIPKRELKSENDLKILNSIIGEGMNH